MKFFVALLLVAAVSVQAQDKMMLTGTVRRAVTDRVWPAAHGDADVCLWGKDKVAAFTLGVDDNTMPDHAWWLTMQEKYDFNMTWWVVTGGLEAGSNPSFNGTWANYVTLQEAGNEIASHSVTHNCDMADADYDTELGDSKAHIAAAVPGQPKVLGYAGPCGNTPPQTTTEKYYIAHRGVSGGCNGPDAINYNSTKVISCKSTTTFYPGEILTPGLNTWRAQYRGWSIHFFHYVKDFRTNVEDQILKPMDENRADLWVAPFGTVAQYAQERYSSTLNVTAVAADEITFTVTDEMLDEYFYYPLLVKVRVNNDWDGCAAVQNGGPVEASLVEHDGNMYALVEAVPDRGEVVLSKVDGAVSGVQVAIDNSQLTIDNRTRTFTMSGQEIAPGQVLNAGVYLNVENGSVRKAIVLE